MRWCQLSDFVTHQLSIRRFESSASPLPPADWPTRVIGAGGCGTSAGSHEGRCSEVLQRRSRSCTVALPAFGLAAADQHLPQCNAARPARIDADSRSIPPVLQAACKHAALAASYLFANRLPPETGSLCFIDCWSWRGRRDSGPLAARAAARPRDRRAKPIAHQREWRGRRDSNPRPPA